MAISPKMMKIVTKAQRMEITDHETYKRLAQRAKKPDDKALLERIASDEYEHALIWKRYSGKDIKPSRIPTLLYVFLSYIMGYTFVIKYMEKREDFGAKAYAKLENEIPEAKQMMIEEQEHEDKLLTMLDEERLKYVGAMVLGMNDALVELTGTLAGLTFALADTKVIALTGIITGSAATLSMAASNYLAERANGNAQALKASIYTGGAYLVTVVFIVLPYLLYPSDMYIAALITMLAVVILIIFFFNFYVAVAKSLNFWKRFGQMAAISLGVALIAFIIGVAAKALLGVDI